MSITAISAGMLMCRKKPHLEFFLVHPGGPFFQNKNEGWWTVPKGLPETGEDLLAAAQREFFEETGIRPVPPFYPLGTVKQKGRKYVHVWMFVHDWDPTAGIQCNEFEIEWPPKSGRYRKFPEIDKAEWMDFNRASTMINAAQRPFLDKAAEILVI